MKRLFLIGILFAFIGCAVTPTYKYDLLVRYPIKGEFVKAYDKDHRLDEYFIIDYEDLEKFIEQEKAKIATSGNLKEK